MNTDKQHILEIYGWDDDVSSALTDAGLSDCEAARIIADGRGLYRCISASGELLAEQSGGFHYLVEAGLQQSPVVGDWCALKPYGDGRGLIELVLPRRSVLHRRVYDGAEESRGAPGSEDVGAANVETVAIIEDISRGLNLRRIERFLANISSGGADPALVLTKADLVEGGASGASETPEASEDPGAKEASGVAEAPGALSAEDYRSRARIRFGSLPIYLVDSISGRGSAELVPLLKPGNTIALVGLSGAGKSTFLNMIAPRSAAKTGDVRNSDGRGRHTTTGSRLYLAPSGSLIIDTPGIRAVGIAAGAGSAEASFEDIAELARHCRFADCRHQAEPGCAVKEALLRGEIEEDRYLNYLRLATEAGTREEELQKRREKDKSFGKMRYRMRKEGRRGGYDGR